MPPYPLLSRFLAPSPLSNLEALKRSVQGKTVLVTGASYGIGESLSRFLAQAGATVLMAARSEDKLEAIRQELVGSGGKAHIFPLDLRQADAVDQAAEDMLSRHGPPHIVVHNAGKSIRRSLLHSLDRAHDFERTMGVNYLGPVRLQLALTQAMIQQGEGQIVNVSSVSVRLPAPAQWAAYHCSKLAFDQWLSAAVPELLPLGISVTSVYLGLVHTRMSAPTKAYASYPGLSAEQAARVVCRGIVKRSRSIAPWWLAPARLLSLPIEGPLEGLQTALLRAFSSR